MHYFISTVASFECNLTCVRGLGPLYHFRARITCRTMPQTLTHLSGHATAFINLKVPNPGELTARSGTPVIITYTTETFTHASNLLFIIF